MIALPDGEDALHGINYGIRATTLLTRLPDAMILHLACHGLQDAKNPLKSGFVMRDRLLTVEELMLVPLPRAFLAFLSACETAKGDKVSQRCLGFPHAEFSHSSCDTPESARSGHPPRGRYALRWLQERHRNIVVSSLAASLRVFTTEH
jgi:hypothetical protein